MCRLLAAREKVEVDPRRMSQRRKPLPRMTLRTLQRRMETKRRMERTKNQSR